MRELIVEPSTKAQFDKLVRCDAVSAIMIHIKPLWVTMTPGWRRRMGVFRYAIRNAGGKALVLRASIVPNLSSHFDRIDLFSSVYVRRVAKHFDKFYRRAKNYHHGPVDTCLNSEMHPKALELFGDMGNLGRIAIAITNSGYECWFDYGMPARPTKNRTWKTEQQEVIARLTGRRVITGSYWLSRAKHVAPGDITQFVIDNGKPKPRPYNTGAEIGAHIVANPDRDVAITGAEVSNGRMAALVEAIS